MRYRRSRYSVTPHSVLSRRRSRRGVRRVPGLSPGYSTSIRGQTNNPQSQGALRSDPPVITSVR